MKFKSANFQYDLVLSVCQQPYFAMSLSVLRLEPVPETRLLAIDRREWLLLLSLLLLLLLLLLYAVFFVMRVTAVELRQSCREHFYGFFALAENASRKVKQTNP